ncbi:MAG: hypothetical protein ACREN2_09385 [Candidatus Dormibacteria bacterium]
MTPLGAVIRGALAGAAGTAALDAYQYVRYRAGGGSSPPLTWEFTVPEDWAKVSAPGQVGCRLIEGFTRKKLSPRWAPLVNNVMHWGYGVGNAVAYGIVVGSLRRPRVGYGLPFGVTVWLSGYALLPLSMIYKPIWEYDAKTLADDLGGHLVFGAVTAATFAALS